MRRALGLATVLAMVALLLVPSTATLGTAPQDEEQPPIETPADPPAPVAQVDTYVPTIDICHFVSTGVYSKLNVQKVEWSWSDWSYHHPGGGHDVDTNDIWPAYQYRIWDVYHWHYYDHSARNWDAAGQAIYNNNCQVPVTTGFIKFVKIIDNWLPEQGTPPLDLFQLTYAGPQSGTTSSGVTLELPFGDYTVSENDPGVPFDFVGVACEPDSEVVLQAVTAVASLSREQRNWTCTFHNKYSVPWFTKQLAPNAPGSAADFNFHVVNGTYVYDIAGSELWLSPDGRTGTYYGGALVGEFTITENPTSSKWTTTYELEGLVKDNACHWIPDEEPVPAAGEGQYDGFPVCMITNTYHPSCAESGQPCAPVTPAPTPVVTPPPPPTPTPVGSVLPTTGTPKPTGEVLPAESTPRPTLPVTSSGTGGDGGNAYLLLVALAIVASAGALVTTTRRQTTR